MFDNPWFKPLRFLITDDQGKKVPPPISNNLEMWLHIEAEIKQFDPALDVGYGVYSEEGELVYWSFHTDEAVEKWPKWERGKYIFRTQIPKRLLNEGIYRIELMAALHFREWVLQSGVNSPSIFLTINGGLSDSPQWMVKRPGILAPIFTWETNIVNENRVS